MVRKKRSALALALSAAIVAAGLSILATAPRAATAEEEQEPATRGRPTDCKADRERLCADATGPRNVAECLAEHQEELSEACRQRIAAQKKPKLNQRNSPAWRRSKAMSAACSGEIALHCADSAKGRPLVQCLRAHDAELSDGCRDALPQPRRKGLQEAPAGS